MLLYCRNYIPINGNAIFVQVLYVIYISTIPHQFIIHPRFYEFMINKTLKENYFNDCRLIFKLFIINISDQILGILLITQFICINMY